MAGDNGQSERRAPDVKAPLALSAVLGLVAFLITSLVGAGGTQSGLRLDLGLIIGGIAFIVSVVVSATLMMLDKPNDPSLGQGTGVNRSSARIYAQRRARRSAEGTRAEGSAAGPSPRGDAGDDEPEFGQRIHPQE